MSNMEYENLERRPHLRVAVTPFCNFKCIYCRPGGEGYFENTNETLSRKDLTDLVSFCGEAGFRDIKITGGEPLLREDIMEVISDIKKSNRFRNIEMVTNGSFLKSKAKALKEAGLDSLTVSLDAADKDIFFKICKSRSFDKVLDGIKEAVNLGIKTRINTVMSQSNKDQLEGLVKIAKNTGADLKIIDIMNVNSCEKSSEENWGKEYLNLDYVYQKLKGDIKNETISYPPGGLGTPMPTFILNSGTKIMLRDATVGTNYDSATCNNCQNYPCQDALISARLTHDGFLKKCLIRNDNLVDIITPFKNGDIKEVKNRIKLIFDVFMRAEYKPNAWKANNK